MIGSAGFVWVAAWLILVKGELRGLLARPSRKEAEVEPARSWSRSPATARLRGHGLHQRAARRRGHRDGRIPLWNGRRPGGDRRGDHRSAPGRRRHPAGARGAPWAASLGDIVRNRRFWLLVVVSITINICWHFLVNWIPSYLKQERGMKFEAGNLLSTIPFLAADAGNLLGGWLSRGSPRAAKRRAGAASGDGRRGAADHVRPRHRTRCERTGRGRAALGDRCGDRGVHGQLLLLHPGGHTAPHRAGRGLPRRDWATCSRRASIRSRV